MTFVCDSKIYLHFSQITNLHYGICLSVLDFTTDGLWCYIVLWVFPHSTAPTVRWSNIKERLLAVCPSFSVSAYLNEEPPNPVASPVYLLTFCSTDRKGLLHGISIFHFQVTFRLCLCHNLMFSLFSSLDVTRVLCELELMIQRVKVTTTPDGRVMDLFFITDNL